MFLKNKNIIFEIRRSKVTDYAALRTEQYWPLQVIQLSEILIERPLPGKFAHLNQLSIRSFDCMVLRSFHTPSRYDFRSNVIRPL